MKDSNSLRVENAAADREQRHPGNISLIEKGYMEFICFHIIGAMFGLQILIPQKGGEITAATE